MQFTPEQILSAYASEAYAYKQAYLAEVARAEAAETEVKELRDKIEQIKSLGYDGD